MFLSKKYCFAGEIFISFFAYEQNSTSITFWRRRNLQSRNLGKTGNPVEYSPMKTHYPFSCLLLSGMPWADRPIVHARLLERHTQRTDGVEERLVAYDQEVAQLKSFAALGELDFDLVFVNNGSDPAVAADTLLSLLRSPHIGSKKEAQHELSRLLIL
jgi:hypothetical protein